MGNLKYEWVYGENEHQKYYEVKAKNLYLCVFCNNWNPNTWCGMVGNSLIHNKTKNDKERIKDNLPIGCDYSLLRADHILCSDNPEYMKEKVEYCYENNITEIDQ